MSAWSHELVQPRDALPAVLLIHRSRSGAGEYISPHWHQSIELSYTRSGSIDDFTIADAHYRTAPGKLLVVNSRHVHSVRVLPRSHASGGIALSMLFPYDLVSGLYPQITDQVIAINDETGFSFIQHDRYRHIVQLCEQVIAEKLARGDRMKDVRLSLLSLQILQVLLRDFTAPRDGPTKGSCFVGERLQQVVDYIDNNYLTAGSLSEIARHIPLSKAYLARFFKKNMGVTVGQYLSAVRARHARIEILRQHGTFEEIALSVGFSGAKTMNRALMSSYGMSARQIQEDHRSHLTNFEHALKS
ncbi:transcriptional regulator, AraC family [Coriobacterium glomerans PW2]|uniref:Transcriptional regulator, AraC family n=1 Tax=Coriobacterium glomerans (strain ATCC 49209 / DSM 20642 / JCM 10262 / PW2) TaxID=700015 RepID=F2N8W6_CORGP|nr:AraC family transcriptional regulator [Coriobacterium glomerans]AEB07566.1 transcriptional regulator, AraC family [Coriobacterium glomerans PW2]